MWNRQKQLSLRLIVKDNSSPDTPPHFSRGPFVWNLESQGQVHSQTSQSYSTCFLPDSHLFSKVPAPRKSFIPMSCWIKGQQWLFDSTKKESLISRNTTCNFHRCQWRICCDVRQCLFQSCLIKQCCAIAVATRNGPSAIHLLKSRN